MPLGANNCLQTTTWRTHKGQHLKRECGGVRRKEEQKHLSASSFIYFTFAKIIHSSLSSHTGQTQTHGLTSGLCFKFVEQIPPG